MELSDFLGDWLLSREIVERDGAVARFIGQASFRPEGAGLHYREVGTLELPDGLRMSAERAYHWRAEAGRIAISFADGRPFHSFDPAAPEAQHWCDPDLYRVRYDFAEWPVWRAIWAVRGPRKHYELTSRYARD